MVDNPSTPVALPKAEHQDPSPLVTEMVQREMAHLEKLMECKVEGVVTKFETRLAGMDKALELVQQFPTEMQRMVTQLKELHEEKFMTLHLILKERDHRATLISDALKEAREKSESSLTKQLDAVESQIATVTRVLDNKIDDMKTRIQVIEGRM